MPFRHKISRFFLIYVLLSRNFLGAIYVLFGLKSGHRQFFPLLEGMPPLPGRAFPFGDTPKTPPLWWVTLPPRA